MNKTFQLIGFILVVSLLVPVASAQKAKFEATLSGKNEVPAVQSSASGRATFQLSMDGKSLAYTISVTGIEDPTMAHIHLAAAGKDGPPVLPLYPSKAHPAKMGKVSGVLARGTATAANLVGPLKGKTLADFVEQLRAGDTYVNVHSKAHPGGELRGQIE